MKTKALIVRYNVPSRYTEGNVGDVCAVEVDGCNPDHYIMVKSSDISYTWVKLGDFFERSLRKVSLDEDFIDCCLDLYLNRSDPRATYNSLSEILSK